MTIQLSLIKQGIWIDEYQDVIRHNLENQLHLQNASPEYKAVSISNHLVQRFCLLAGLSRAEKRTTEQIDKVTLKSNTFHDTIFSKDNYNSLWTALLKMKYKDLAIDWDKPSEKSKIINFEMEQGAKLLLEDDQLKKWLMGLVT